MSRSAEPTDTGTDDPPSVLFVSDERGWPRTTGYRRRTSQMLAAVAELGPTTWVVAPRNRHDAGDPIVLPGDLADQVAVVHAAAPTRARWRTAVRWITSGLPWSLAAGDWRPVERRLEELASQRFDLIWAMGIDAFLATGRAGLHAPVTVVDADLESVKLQRQLADGSMTGRLRRMIALVDRRRWHRLEQRTAALATCFSVCSDNERRVLGGRAMTTPNGYPLVTPEQWSTGGSGANTLLFIGSLSYGPNLDGLRWFTSDVLPILRNRVPDVELRVVGSGAGDLEWLAAVPGVSLIGPVDDVVDELGRAAAVIAPITWGAGTRIKIVEAFAHRVPVISTTVGAEGLDVRSGRELMVADEPGEFADACRRVFDDPDLRERLIDKGHETFAARYEESAIRHRLATRLSDLIRSVPATSPSSSR